MAPYPVDDIDVEDVIMDATPESAQENTASPKSTTSLAVGKYHVSVDNRALPYIGIVGASMVLMIALLSPDVEFKNETYGVVVAVVAMIFALLGIYLVQKNMDLYSKQVGTVPVMGELTVGRINAYLLFLWSFVGTSVLTFNDPFLYVSNGWVAAWASVVFSVMTLEISAETMQSKAKDMGYFSALLFASIVQLCAIVPELDSNEGQTLYSLIVCIMTILLILAFGNVPDLAQYKSPVFAVFAILWLVLACFVTFEGPFVPVGNGWFSAWAGCILSVMIIVTLRSETSVTQV
jgi:hypothetical protein